MNKKELDEQRTPSIIYGCWHPDVNWYVGQTIQTLHDRMKDHNRFNLTPFDKKVTELGGIENFDIVVFTKDLLNRKERDDLEIFYQEMKDSVHNGMNTKYAGSRGAHSQETKDLISNMHKGKVFGSAEARQKGIEKRTGRKLPDDQVASMRMRVIEYYKNPDNIKKHSERTKKFYQDPNNRKKHSERMKLWHAERKKNNPL